MKITCEFCGSVIDTTKNVLCPNCGASIKDNPQFKEYQKYKREFDKEMRQLEFAEQQEDVKRKKLENEKLRRNLKTKNGNTAVKMVLAILSVPVIGFIVFATIVCLIAVNYGGNSTPEVETTAPYVEQYHELQVGETASMQYYDFQISEWGYYTPASYAIHKGEKYIKLKFVIANTHDDRIVRDESINCYDQNGGACKEQYSLISDDENVEIKKQYVQPGQTYSAYAYFIVPENETQLTVHYGKYIKVIVDLTEEVSNEVN